MENHALANNIFLDCYALPLDGFDVGFQWPSTLGPITWDFTNNTTSFVREGHWQASDMAWPATSSLLGSYSNLHDVGRAQRRHH